MLGCRNCSETFPVGIEALSVTQSATSLFDLYEVPLYFCSDKSVQSQTISKTYPIQNVSLSKAELSSQRLSCSFSGAETASKAAFLT